MDYTTAMTNGSDSDSSASEIVARTATHVSNPAPPYHSEDPIQAAMSPIPDRQATTSRAQEISEWQSHQHFGTRYDPNVDLTSEMSSIDLDRSISTSQAATAVGGDDDRNGSPESNSSLRTTMPTAAPENSRGSDSSSVTESIDVAIWNGGQAPQVLSPGTPTNVPAGPSHPGTPPVGTSRVEPQPSPRTPIASFTTANSGAISELNHLIQIERVTAPAWVEESTGPPHSKVWRVSTTGECSPFVYKAEIR